MKFDPVLQEKLERVAADEGRGEAPVKESVERMLGYDEWFLGEVERGIAAADTGKLLDHEEVRKLIDRPPKS